MAENYRQTYTKNEAKNWPIPNYWDCIAAILIFSLLLLLGSSLKHMSGEISSTLQSTISLDPAYLPYYALRSVVRMFLALFFSFIFTFTIGTWAAKSRWAERIIIPAIDILQSVPVLGFLSLAIPSFILLFHGSLLGPECASIFAIFTAQVWNITLSFYQSLITVPKELEEAAHVFHLSAWQRFWRLEVPYAMPGLLWNTMMSMSGSWVFLLASEAISLGKQTISLPGIGSYTALAIKNANGTAIIYVIIAMLLVIAIYDQLFFRPLLAWGHKFKMQTTVDEAEPEAWLLNLMQRTRLLKVLGYGFQRFTDICINHKVFHKKKSKKPSYKSSKIKKIIFIPLVLFIILALTLTIFKLYDFIFSTIPLSYTLHLLYLGFYTTTRVVALIIISSLIWVPLGVIIGLNPKLSAWVQPIAQFLAAFPANLLFPVAAIVIVHYNLNVNIWTSPLMILGTQWYILFNVIAGTISLPNELHAVSKTLQLKGWVWWKRFILPGIFPYYITGAITAAGGAWNMSVIAEAIDWGKIHLRATGLGAKIADIPQSGHYPEMVLSIIVMSVFVLIFNYTVWRPLYQLAEKRFQVN